MCHKTAINKIFWLDLWQGWCTPRPLQGHCHSQHASPRDTLSTAEVPWHGHIPVSLCALSLLLYCTPPWPAKEGCWVHLEWNIPRCLWLSQEPSMFWHHFVLLWCLQASHHSSWCLQERPWSCPSTRWMPCCLCIQSADPTKQCYAKIEHELLTCIFGTGHFCTYVFGCEFTIESNHKPLEQTMLKNLADAPAHLQRMLLCLQDYNIHIKYQPGREMLIVDALSHYAWLATPAIPLTISVNHLHITPQKKMDFQDAVCSDPTLCAEMILLGWPEDVCDVPMDICP